MPYTKTTWTDEVPASTPVKYVITDDVLGEVAGSATIALVTSVTPGTALNAANFNKIENALEDAIDDSELALSTANAAFALSELSQAILFAVKTAVQNISASTYTDITGWETEVIKSGGCTFNKTTGEITLTAGRYYISASIEWETHNTGNRVLRIADGEGITYVATKPATGWAGSVILNVYVIVATTKTITLETWQDSGGARDLDYALVKIIKISDY